MSDLEFIGKMNPKPFKSLATIEKERLEEVRQEFTETSSKPWVSCLLNQSLNTPESHSLNDKRAMFLQMHLHPPLHPDSLLLLSFTKTSLLAQSFNSI